MEIFHASSGRFTVFAASCIFVTAASALEIRTYGASRHDRFTGYPAAPAFNDGAWYGSRKYSGVAWIPGEANSRQFALVSPCHVVFATHYLPGAGTTIRFLNTDGVMVDRTVAASQQVPNDANLPTDLTVLTLSSPITAGEKVAHFPYLNLSSESAYVGTMLTVFGWDMKAGRGAIASFEDSDGTEINTTRLMAFRYRKLTGNQDDAYVVVGDSGSPTFASAGGNPAIVGIHTAAGDSPLYRYGYDTFLPHYAAKLDTLMSPLGYRMTPAYPPVVALSAAVVAGSPLRQAYAGSSRFDLSNTGSNDAGNCRVVLHFPPGTSPDSVVAAGWIAEMAGPQDWVFRKANLAAGAVAEFTASWASVPTVGSISVEASRVADGSPLALQTFDLAPIPTFKAWAAGLDDPTEGGDPDQDGVPNLLEYAFGGNGGVPSRLSADGWLLLPEISMAGGSGVLRFPVREDAAVRGLSYVVETSDDLAVGGWSVLAVSESDTTSPLSSGFLLRTVTWSADAERRFARVKVALAE